MDTLTIVLITLGVWLTLGLLSTYLGYRNVVNRGGECFTIGELTVIVLIITLLGPIGLIMMFLQNPFWGQKIRIGPPKSSK